MAHWCWPQFMMNTKCAQHTAQNPKLRVVAIKRLKDPPTWLRVAITLENTPAPTHIYIQRVENVKQFWTVKQSRYKCRCRGWRLWKQSETWSSLGNDCFYVPLMLRQWVSEWVIKFNGLSGDSGQWGPYSPYKLCNHSFYIGIIIFPHIDNT